MVNRQFELQQLLEEELVKQVQYQRHVQDHLHETQEGHRQEVFANIQYETVEQEHVSLGRVQGRFLLPLEACDELHTEAVLFLPPIELVQAISRDGDSRWVALRVWNCLRLRDQQRFKIRAHTTLARKLPMDLSNVEERWESARREIQEMLNKHMTSEIWTGILVENTKHKHANYSMLDVNVHGTLHDTLHKCVKPLQKCMTERMRRNFHFSFEPVCEEQHRTSSESFSAYGPIWL